MPCALCRVHIGLCRVLWPLAHGKAAVTRSHQMVGPRLFGAPILESSAQQQLHCRRVVWSLAFRRVRFLFRPSRQKYRNGWGVLTRRCVVYKEKMLGIVMDLNRKMCLSDDCFFFLDSYQKNMDPKRQDN